MGFEKVSRNFCFRWELLPWNLSQLPAVRSVSARVAERSLRHSFNKVLADAFYAWTSSASAFRLRFSSIASISRSFS